MGFFTDGNAKSVSFDEKNGFKPGTTWSGVITQVGTPQQATVFGTGEPEFWSKSGQKRMTQSITIKAEQVQPSAEDDGQRAIWFKDGHGLKKALRDAIFAYPAVQRREPEVGDWISITWTGVDAEFNQKIYQAQWKPGQGSGFITGQQAPVQAQQSQQYQQVPQQQFVPQQPVQPQQQVHPVTGAPVGGQPVYAGGQAPSVENPPF